MAHKIDRRALLGWTVAGAFGLAGGGALVFGKRGDLRVAWSAARASGRPLLVVLIPSDPARYNRAGERWGAILNSGSQAVLADLALCVVVCAKLREVHEVFGNSEYMPFRETDAVLVEPATGVPSSLEFDLVDFETEPFPYGRTPEVDFETVVRERLVPAEQDLRAAIAADVETLERREHEAELALGAARVNAIRTSLETTAGPTQGDAELAPAVVRLAAERTPARRDEWTALLASVTQKSIVDAPPQGAAWATSFGCGVTVEGRPEESCGIACGMAMNSAVSSRFLYFYTDGA